MKLTPEQRLLHDAVLRDVSARGLLIEAGFAAMRAVVLPADASANEVHAARSFYMHGAQHLFASIMSILDPGSEPTANDLACMSMIASELDRFAAESELERSTPGGHA